MSDDPNFSESEKRRHNEALGKHFHKCIVDACAEALVADQLFAAPQITILRNAEQPIFTYEIAYQEGGRELSAREKSAVEAAPECAYVIRYLERKAYGELPEKEYVLRNFEDDLEDDDPRRLAVFYLLDGWQDYNQMVARELTEWKNELID